MKIKAPSPAMGVATAALIMATTGTAVAGISYATNAGKVDGRDAVSSKASTDKAAGALVATAGAGPSKGKIPGKFLDGVQHGDADSFARLADVQDNTGDVPGTLATLPGIGGLTATCGDQNTKAGTEDPVSRLVIANTSAVGVNVAKTVSNGAPEVAVIAPNTTSTITIGGTSTFHVLLEQQGTNTVIDGVVRQDGRNTAAAQCLVFGYTEQIANVR